jgi:hypothetical protein
MDVGYRTLLGHVTRIHVRTEEYLIRGQQTRLDNVMKYVSTKQNPADREKFQTIYARVFAMPEIFEFQPHKGDEVS